MARDPRRERRLGLVYGLAAYGSWGVFPIYLKAVRSVPVVEVLSHRIVWALAVLLVITGVRGKLQAVAAALRHRRALLVLSGSTVLIAINWLVYIYSVTHDRMLESSLGYYINPLISVLLGIGHHVMSGKGRSPGFAAELDRFPDDDVTIILLSNSYASVSQDPIAGALAAIVFGQQPTPPALHAAAIPQSALASYAGMYQYGPEYFEPNAKFTLTAEPGYLLLELGDLRTPVVPLLGNDFLERNFFGHVVMSRDAGGTVNGPTTRYGEKEFAARRVEAK